MLPIAKLRQSAVAQWWGEITRYQGNTIRVEYDIVTCDIIDAFTTMNARKNPGEVDRRAKAGPEREKIIGFQRDLTVALFIHDRADAKSRNTFVETMVLSI